MNTELFVNRSTSLLARVIRNKGVRLEPIDGKGINRDELHRFRTVYRIFIDNERTGKVIKSYNHVSLAESEQKNLEELVGVEGVPQLYDSHTSKELSWTIMSELKGRDLFDYLFDHNCLPLHIVKNIGKQLIRIVHDMHERGVIHGDIKLENMMYDPESGETGLIDFDEKRTFLYQSPELARTTERTEAGDMWSVGVALYLLAVGEYPFPDGANKNRTLIFPHFINDELYCDLLRHLLDRDERTRYSAKKAMKHAWIRG